MKWGAKMSTRIIEEAMMILMQLIWKVVQPEDLKPGQHIYRYGLQGVYSHHGIYVGDGYVIHYTRTEDKKTICPSLSKTSHKQCRCPDFPECENQGTIKRGVVKTCVDCFRRDGNTLRSLHCYGYGRQWIGFARPGTCTALPDTKSSPQVVEKARQLHVGNGFGDYCLINNNCEHFATFCRTDIPTSEQTAFLGHCAQKIMEAKERTMRLL